MASLLCKFLAVWFLASSWISSSCQVINRSQSISHPGESKIKRHIFWDSIPNPVGYVNDYENIFSDEEERILDSIIADFENKTSVQIAVLSFDASMTTADSLDELTLRFANHWGIGQKNKNNGIAIGISKGNKRMRIQNGKGITQYLSDTETKAIIDKDFIPLFRYGNYFQGTINGLSGIMKILLERNVQ